jgi:hypothetical protein
VVGVARGVGHAPILYPRPVWRSPRLHVMDRLHLACSTAIDTR